MKKLSVLMLGLLLVTALHSATVHAAQWYKGELHCHSYWSDGNTLPELAIDWYRSNGFHFMSLTDHNVLQLDQNKWREFDPARLEESKKKFGDDFVETKVENEKTLVRLKTIHELRELFNKDGEFHLIPGHEQNAGVAGRTLHANGINISESIPFPNTFPTVAEAALAWRKSTLENAEKSGNVGFWMLNHPEWPYFDVGPEVLIEASDIEFYEWNTAAGATQIPVHPDHPKFEKYWDIVNAFRLLAGKKPVYLVVANDTHGYPRPTNSGWVVVRSEKLEANALFTAMKKGDFYSSTGVELNDIRFDAGTGTLSVEVKPEEGVLYSIRFVGTKKDFDTKTRTFEDPQVGPNKPARIGTTYSNDIGMTLQTVAGTSASYQMVDDDLYVRAVITSNKPPKSRSGNEPATLSALTQPYTRIAP